MKTNYQQTIPPEWAAMSKILAPFPEARFLVISAMEQRQVIEEALERGARGFLLGFGFGWHGMSPCPPRQPSTLNLRPGCNIGWHDQRIGRKSR